MPIKWFRPKYNGQTKQSSLPSEKSLEKLTSKQIFILILRILDVIFSRVKDKTFNFFCFLGRKISIFYNFIAHRFPVIRRIENKLKDSHLALYYRSIKNLLMKNRLSRHLTVGTVFVFLIILGLANRSQLQFALSATFGWVQNSWSGGVDTVNFANHANRSSWNKYYSKDAGVEILGDTLKLVQNNYNWLETSSTQFGSGTNSNTFVSSTGNLIVLLKKLNATCGHNTECASGICESFICQPPPCNGETQVTDSRDSKVYSLVEIGTQCWFKQNINVGTKIALSGNPTNNSLIEKWCDGDSDANCSNSPYYGGFYTWAEAMQIDPGCNSTSTCAFSGNRQGICPSGWHVPSDAEFKTLEKYLGMSQSAADASGDRGTDQGTKLKVGGSSGFEALLGGYKYHLSSSISYQGQTGYYLTATAINADTIWKRAFEPARATVARYGYDTYSIKSMGYNVRCVKDRGKAIGDLCTADSQCGSGLCQTTCKIPNGSYCASGSTSCATGSSCLNNACRIPDGSSCLQNTDCNISSGSTCVSGTCKGAIGAACTDGNQCITGSCIAGVCSPWIYKSQCNTIQLYYQDSASSTWGPYNSTCSSPTCVSNFLSGDNSYNFTNYPARNACKTLGGRLPTPTELTCLYSNRTSYSPYSLNTAYEYWSSQQIDAFSAFTLYLPNGGSQISRHKTNIYPVRCIKDVPSSCVNDTDCVSSACYGNVCIAKQANGGTCNSHQDCTNNNCTAVGSNGTCGGTGAPCTGGSSADAKCVSGKCNSQAVCLSAAQANGYAYCDTNVDCLSGYCNVSISTCETPPAQPSITRSPSTLNLSASIGYGTSGNITLTNNGSAILSSWSASASQLSGPASWCSVWPNSGTNLVIGGSVNLTVSASAQGSAGGPYSCTITLIGTGAANSPQTATVNYTVNGGPSCGAGYQLGEACIDDCECADDWCNNGYCDW